LVSLIFDIETDNLLPKLTKLNCLVVRDADTGDVRWSLTGLEEDEGFVQSALAELQQADRIIGHNILGFDVPALEKLFGLRFDRTKCIDTLLLTQVLWPEIKQGDFLRFHRGEMPGHMIGRHALEAWGYRLGEHKGEYTAWCAENGIEDPWSCWRPEMQDYCIQDTLVNWKLWQRIEAKNLDPRCLELEHQIAVVCRRITDTGFPFDEEAAGPLFAVVQERMLEAQAKLLAAFPPLQKSTTKIAGASNKKLGRVKGQPYTITWEEPIDPASGDSIAEHLTAKYGWKPGKFTPKTKDKPEGERKATIDEDVLSSLPYPEKDDLLSFAQHAKIVAFFAPKNAHKGWMRLARAGRLHATYKTAGTVTGRAAHADPNIAQVPKVMKGKDKSTLLGADGGYGWECRSLFSAPRPDWLLVGADMSGLELRCLAHYLARYDRGRFIHLVCEGDVHTANQEAAGLDTRDQAKTFIYAFLYGAGGWKLGHVARPEAADSEKPAIGYRLMKRFLTRTPGLGDLRDAVMLKAKTSGTLIGLDGRPLTVRKEHAALNTLLQSAGAVLCKRWVVDTAEALEGRGLDWGADFQVHAWIHDELQIGARTQEIAEIIAEVTRDRAQKAGETFRFRCPLDGEAKIGRTWADTH
jgi:DNA polymerase I